jgi:hypothetical protein
MSLASALEAHAGVETAGHDIDQRRLNHDFKIDRG